MSENVAQPAPEGTTPEPQQSNPATGRSNGDPSDTAILHDGKGNDTLTASGSAATLTGPGYSLAVSKFHKVTAYATAGGVNRKVVHLPVDFVFVALGHWS